MYQAFVFAHLAGLVLFVFCHGTSAFVAFRLRRARDAGTVAAYLELSNAATRVMYPGLVLLGVGGLGAAWYAGFLATPWVLATTAVFVLVLLAMFAVGARYYYDLRDRLQPRSTGEPGLDGPELAGHLQNRVPEILTVVGAAGLALMVGLMAFKPA